MNRYLVEYTIKEGWVTTHHSEEIVAADDQDLHDKFLARRVAELVEVFPGGIDSPVDPGNPKALAWANAHCKIRKVYTAN